MLMHKEMRMSIAHSNTESEFELQFITGVADA